MKLHISKDYESMSQEVANEIAAYMQKTPRAVVCFPTGESPKGFFRILAARPDAKELFAEATIVALDEWVGVEKDNPGTGTYALTQDFLIPMGIPLAHVKFFDSMSKTLEEDCLAMDRFVDAAGGFDIVVVGVGRNGHVGLNEPGASVNSDCHVQKLDEITYTVGQRYFKDDSHKVIPYGVTIGMKRMISAKKLMVIASGEVKADVMGKALNEPSSSSMPVSLLRASKNLEIYLDEAAASKVKGRP